jgi:hypothetical protein
MYGLRSSIDFAALALAEPRSLLVAGAAQFGDDHRLVELCNRAQDLANQHGSGGFVGEAVRAVGRDQRDALG